MSAAAPWASLLQLGNEVDFRNVIIIIIIIMTSNIGAKNIAQKIRESSLDFAVSKPQVNKDEEIRNDVMRDLKKVMSPELINRIDSVIVFQQLAMEQVRSSFF
jgi:ATP-dependent Clp protease ATP-binding subunit ClpC